MVSIQEEIAYWFSEATRLPRCIPPMRRPRIADRKQDQLLRVRDRRHRGRAARRHRASIIATYQLFRMSPGIRHTGGGRCCRGRPTPFRAIDVVIRITREPSTEIYSRRARRARGANQ
jgi:hypothetical protein